uniref:G-protein coupled receptors family 1 profile domain-containing protein n=1 Tax=Latimeria chalumnae TaxID=7897 RepID=H3AUD9_LATCH
MQATASYLSSTEFWDDEDLIFLCEKQDIRDFQVNFVPVFYYLAFTLSVLGNGLILVILVKYEKLKTVTNIFILNLVISDLLFTFSLPFWAFYLSSEWIFKNIMCKMINAIFFIGFYSSIMFLTVMTIEQYLMIVQHFSVTITRKPPYAALTCMIVWIVSVLVTIPEFIFSGIKDSEQGLLCDKDVKTHVWNLIASFQQIVLFFLVPLAIVSYCYIRIIQTLFKHQVRRKDKVLKQVFIIVVVFFLCWTPYNVVVFLDTLNYSQASSSQKCDSALDFVRNISENIAYFHCCMNSLCFTFVGTKFRQHLSNLLK